VNAIKFQIAIGAVAAALPLVAALPAVADPNGIGGRVFALNTENGSGEFGTVALKPLGQQTAVEVHVVNVPAGEVQPTHIHYGTCAAVQPPIIYSLSPIVDGTSESIIDVPLTKLLATPSVVHVHTSYKTEHSSVACAELSTK
jgi:hypothetical protein